MSPSRKNICPTAGGRSRTASCGRAHSSGTCSTKSCARSSGPRNQIGLRASYSRYLGFLARHDPNGSGSRRRPDGSKLDQGIRSTSTPKLPRYLRGELLHKLRLVLGFICPQYDWSWLKIVANVSMLVRHPAAIVHGVSRAPNSMRSVSRSWRRSRMPTSHVADPRKKRRSPTGRADHRAVGGGALRRRTLTALTTMQHLVKIGDRWLLDIPAADTKTGRPLEFPLPDPLSRRVGLYLTRLRVIIPGANNHNGLWPSTRGKPMDGGSIYDAVRRRTMEALGLPVNLHRFRLAAGNLWSIADPANVRGVKDLLGQTSFGTTEKHYIGAQSRLAGRTLAKVLRPSRH